MYRRRGVRLQQVLCRRQSGLLSMLLLLLILQSRIIHAEGRDESSSSSDVGDSSRPDADDTTKSVPVAIPSNVEGRISLDEIENAQHTEGLTPEKEHWPEFLSATVVLRISPVSNIMDSARQGIFSTAITAFLEKIFNAQSKYDIAVRSVNVIQQSMASEMWEKRDRWLKDSSPGDAKEVRQRQDQNDIVLVETIITSQYVPTTGQELTTDDFKRMLLHVFATFEENLVQIFQAEEAKATHYAILDGYFSSIDNVVMEVLMSDGAEISNAKESSTGGGDGMRVVGIVGFVIGAIALAALSIFSFANYREQVFDKVRATLATGKSLVSSGASETTFNLQSIGREDTYSFSSQEDILRKSSMPSKKSPVASDGKKNRKLRFGGRQVLNLEDKISKFDLSERFGKKSSKAGSTYTQVSPDTAQLQTHMEEGVLRNECYAPPGKLGVAVDTVHGQPVVHRIKDGSPLEGVLQHMDKIVAIDGVDTSNMSSADVTRLMVKGMNRVRKITFIRGNGDEASRNKGNSDKSIDPDWPTSGSAKSGY